MSRQNKNIIGLILLAITGLILKKLMIPGASFVLMVAMFSLAVQFLILAFRSVKTGNDENNSPLIFSLAYFDFSVSSVAFLFRIEYWNFSDLLLWISFPLLIIFLLLLIYYFFFYHSNPLTEKKIVTDLMFPLVFFVLIIPFSSLSNQRQFHNFFKGSTYESYVRKMYPEGEAKKLLEENQCSDPSCIEEANNYYLEGLKNDSLKNYDEAFECYNKAIDYNIHFAEAYVSRASNRMLHAFVDKDIAVAAIHDCSIAIELNPTYAPAFLRRGFTNIFANNPAQACDDFRKAKALDSTYKIEKYIKSTCDEVNKNKRKE